METVDHLLVLKEVGQGQHYHTLVVGHVGSDNGFGLARGQTGLCEIDSFIISVATLHSQVVQTIHIIQYGVGFDWEREERGIRRNDCVFSKSAFKTKARDAKSPILIITSSIEGVKARLGDPPGNLPPSSIANLTLNGIAHAACEEGVIVRA